MYGKLEYETDSSLHPVPDKTDLWARKANLIHGKDIESIKLVFNRSYPLYKIVQLKRD